MDVPERVARTTALTPAAWTDAALATIADKGISHVSVERLAKELGATKGSFYWHFADRPALIQAALDRWENVYTDRVLAELGAVPDPRDRFRALLHTTFSELPGVHIDAALLTEGRDPQVAPVLGRVARKRLAFLEQIFADLGYSHAKDRALLATTAYIGLAQLRRSAPDLTPSSRRVRAYVDHAVDALLAE